MSMRIVPLAYNEHGHRFPVSQAAAYWLVKSMRKGPGAPRQLWVEDQAMTLPIDDGMSDLRELAGAGRFRLDPIDQNGVPVPGMPPAYVEVIDTTTAAAPAALRNAAPPIEAPPMVPVPISEFLRVIEALALAHAHSNRDSNTNLAALIEATAVVVRAADGAGISSRAYMRNADLAEPEPVEVLEAPPEPPALPAPAAPTSLRDMLTEKLVASACRGIDAFVAQKLGAALAPALPPAPTPRPASTPAAPSTASTTAPPRATVTTNTPPPTDRPAAARPNASTSTTMRPAPSTSPVETPPAAPAPTPSAPSSPTPLPSTATAPTTDASAPSALADDALASTPSSSADLATATSTAEQHLRNILDALTPEEHSQVTTLAALAPPEQMNAFLAHLAGMPVGDALAMIRAHLQRLNPTTSPTEPPP
jgi:hypothetical protein